LCSCTTEKVAVPGPVKAHETQAALADAVEKANQDNFAMLSNSYLKVNRFDEAVQSFTVALSCDPVYKVPLNLTRSLIIVHQYDHAIAARMHATEMGGSDIHAQLEFARSLYELSRYDEGMAISTTVLFAINPETRNRCPRKWTK
jgi:tetratricopeptide (TPR) repeat protein